MTKAKPIFIEGRRDGYAPSQCYKTFTVGRIIGILEGFDKDAPVYLINDNGYTFGSIDYDSFISEDDDNYYVEEPDDDDENYYEEESEEE